MPEALPVPAAQTGASSGGAPVVIEAAGLAKAYQIYRRPSDMLRELVFGRKYHEDLYALHDINFSVRRGEVVGLIGANGAGKSTLLKILCDRLDHTAGDVRVSGKVSAVLELGTGFHDEYTGLDNIFMGGLCLGYSQKEMEESLPWILEFTGLRDFIRQPFRTYSSGMKSRLTFAVAFCKVPDVLIVDEALSVGDMLFVNRCVNHILGLCRQGATALVVSHNMFLVERLCTRALYLKKGRLEADGAPLNVCKRFEKDMMSEFSEAHSAEMAHWARGAAGGASVGPAPARPPPVPPPTEASPAAPAAPAAAETPAAPQPAPGTALPADIPWAGAEGEAVPEQERDGDVLTGYLRLPDGRARAVSFEASPPVLHLNWVEFLGCKLLNEKGEAVETLRCGETATFLCRYRSRLRKRNVCWALLIHSQSGIHVATVMNRRWLGPAGEPGVFAMDLEEGEVEFGLRLPRFRLAAGHYFATFGLAPTHFHFSLLDTLCQAVRCLAFNVHRADHSQDVLYEPCPEWFAPHRLGP